MARLFPRFRRYYRPGAFWKTVRRHATQAGLNLIYSALVLYYAAEHPNTPAWARKTIYGALGYLIFPADAVPDWLPGGYADDAMVIAAALAAIAMHITDEVKATARQKLRDWFDGAAGSARLIG